MPEPGAFRQVDEKHVAFEAELMVWSPKFDLVALSNLQGEVVLHRLSWQKVWSLPPPGEEVKVKAMAWRCDGKVLAVGYTSGTVNLCYIENADILHSLSVPGEVTCLSWICQSTLEGQTWSCDPYPEDKSDHYLPRLQPLNKRVIDGSIKNFKAFFRWLYVVILRLSDEKPPPELSKMTQHDVNFVADFLKDNFAQFSPREEAESIADLRAVSPTDKKPGFKLEKVGQYLKKEDLHYPPDIAGNPWIQFCRASYHLKDSKILYPVESQKSLLQLQETLEQATHSCLSRPSVTIGQSMAIVSSLFLFPATASDDNGKPFMPKVSQFTSTESKLLYTVFTADFLPCERLFVLRQPTNSHSVAGNIQITSVKFGRLHPPDHDSSVGSSSDRCDNHKVIDLMCYDDKHLAVLLIEDTDDEIPVLVKLPLSLLPDSSYINMSATAGVTTSSDIPLLDMSDHGLDNQHYRRLENMKAHSFAVSGTRHTATVLFSSRRRVRIFLMDAEEDDDDDDDLEDTNMSNQSAASTQSEADALSQSATSMIIEGGTDGGGEEGKENKENTSLISEEGEELQT